MSEPAKYYVIYPDPKRDKTPLSPSNLDYEIFDTIEEARKHAQEIDRKIPGRDFIVMHGTMIGFSFDDAYDASFLDAK